MELHIILGSQVINNLLNAIIFELLNLRCSLLTSLSPNSFTSAISAKNILDVCPGLLKEFHDKRNKKVTGKRGID